MEVFLRPFPGPARRWQVSSEGGTHPVWSRNGRELLYRNGDKMMAVDVDVDSEPMLSQPRILFEQRYAFGIGTTIPNHDCSPDGERCVMVKDESGSRGLSLVLNWFEELKTRVPTEK
jgi:serine/threonine-protein kinase